MNKILDINRTYSKAKELTHHMNPEISKRNVQSRFRLKAHPTHSPNFDMCLACIPQRNSSFFFYKITFHMIALKSKPQFTPN